MKKLLTIFSLGLLTACGGGAEVETDLAGLRDMGDQIQIQLNIRDAAALAAIYGVNGSVMPPNAETVSGRDSIEQFWNEMLASGNIFNVKGDRVRANGNIGYRVGTYTIASPHNQLLDRGKYVEVWHHDESGWHLMYDIFNSDRPVPAQE
ncbi:MAG: nuclear transport factor 2 family protein [Woeseiaceae bacterium]|nr:nuclear transport factor 2 family protein [Woeseiaceae bacterium]